MNFSPGPSPGSSGYALASRNARCRPCSPSRTTRAVAGASFSSASARSRLASLTPDAATKTRFVIVRSVFRAAVAQPAFQADLIAARAELAAVQATGARNPGCLAETRALATPLP